MGLGGGRLIRFKRERERNKAYRRDAERILQERMESLREVDRLARRDEQRRRR